MAGTFGQQDPLDNPFQTNGWNRYNYAGQDSVNLADPNGMGDWWNPTSWSCDVCGQWASNFWNQAKAPLAGCAVGALGGAVLSAGNPLGIAGGCWFGFTEVFAQQVFGDPVAQKVTVWDYYNTYHDFLFPEP